MARYTGLFIVAVPTDRLRQLLIQTLESCNLNIIHDAGDYLIAREVPGNVSFAKLVTVEVVIHRSSANKDEVKLKFLITNEELALQVNNYCRQIFDMISEAIADNNYWQLVKMEAG